MKETIRKNKKVRMSVRNAGLRIFALILTLGFFLGIGCSGTADGSFFLGQPICVQAASGSVSMSKILEKCKVAVLDRPASEGLWCIRVDGKKAFCLNSGKTMNAGDTADGKTHDAATYKNQSLAKVLTYYFGEKDQGGGNKTFLLCQAYVWACGKGVSKKTAMIEAGKNLSISKKNALAVYKEIENTEPYGKITYYTIKKCKKKIAGSKHQHVVSWSGTKPKKPSYGSYNEPYSAEATEEIALSVEKKDAETGILLDGAVFDIYRDSKKVTSVTAKGGKASYTYTASYTTTVKPTKSYVWVKNWKSLTAAQQKEEKAKGHYSSEAKAIAACKADLKAKAEAALASLKTATHTWMIREVKAPKNHVLDKNSDMTWKETGKATGHTFVFQDTPVKMTLQLVKKSSESGKNLPSLEGAVYSLFAGETILASDLSTEKYHKDDLVGTLTTDSEGKAELAGLLPGKYVLKEEKAPEGYLLNEETTDVDLSAKNQTESVQNVSAAVSDTPIKGKIHIKKTFGGEKQPVHLVTEKVKDETYTPGLCEHHAEHTESCGYEEDEENNVLSPCGYICEICSYKEEEKEETLKIADTFAVIDSQGNTLDTIRIDDNGEGTSGELSFGTYTLHQTETTEGYDSVPDMEITIKEADETIELALDDPKEDTAIYLTKLKTIADKETGTYKKKPEEGAVFEVYDPDGERIKTITTNENGIACADGLKTQGTYTIKQIRGDADYQLIGEKKVTVDLKKASYVTYEDAYTGSKLRIRKYKKKETKEAEEKAVFYLLKADGEGMDTQKLSEMTEGAERTDWVAALPEDTVIARLETDASGEAAVILEDVNMKDNPAGYILYQTAGEKGYALQAPVSCESLNVAVEDGVYVFTYTAVDEFDEWGNISLTKYKTINEHETAPEVGAKFTLTDDQGNVVATETADEKGMVTFEKISFGTYQLQQIAGDADHEWMAAKTVTLTEEEKHKTLNLSEEPLVDKEKEIPFLLTKYSSETKAVVSGARYELYKITENEDKTTDSELITTLLTNETASEVSLPYGSYLLKEVYPADGFDMDQTEYTFTLCQESVKTNEEGAYVYPMDVYDKPLTGTIAVNKTGEALADYSDEEESFKNETSGIGGAVYGLYAREDILRDDGSVAYAADTLIDEKTTGSNGYVKFTRTDENGQETEEFLLGSYYVKETKAPAGYQLDSTEHDVVLTWDNKTEQFDDIREHATTEDVEDSVGNNTEDPDEEKYMLMSGEKLNAILKEENYKYIYVGVYSYYPSSAQDVSMAQDGSVGLWSVRNGVGYIGIKVQDQAVIFPPDSSHMFDGLTSLEWIYFMNTDFSKVEDMSYMFRNTTKLRTINRFTGNMSNVKDTTDMFAGSLWTYGVDMSTSSGADVVYEEDTVGYIEAAPINAFTSGHVYEVEDFIFTLYYTNGKCEEITLTDEEVDISSESTGSSGQELVTFTFKGDTYGSVAPAVCTVDVEDPDQLKVVADYAKPEKILAVTDDSQPISIQLVKTDADDENHAMLAGAEFTLYAACDIVDKDQHVIVKKDQVLQTQISGGDNFSYVEFAGLPSEIYKKDPSAEFMYYIRETKAPDGYYGNDKTIYITGKIIDESKKEQVYGWSNLPSAAADSAFQGSAEHLYKNEKIPYLVLKKEWVNDTESGRPEEVHVTVTLPDETVREFTLTKESGWTLITDIDANVFKGRLTTEVEKFFKEEKIAGYVESGSSYDKGLCLYTFRNTPDVTPVRFKLPMTGTCGWILLAVAVGMVAVGWNLKEKWR